MRAAFRAARLDFGADAVVEDFPAERGFPEDAFFFPFGVKEDGFFFVFSSRTIVSTLGDPGNMSKTRTAAGD